MPFVNRICLDRRVVITEPAEQLMCPECDSAFELDNESIDFENAFDVDCPECECTMEIQPIEVVSPTAINFTPAKDIVEFLNQYDNKTAVLNAAVRLLKSSVEDNPD